jgi:hypothetical protein
MENAIIWSCVVLAIYYLYRQLISKNGCGCSAKNGCAGQNAGQPISKETLCNRGRT